MVATKIPLMQAKWVFASAFEHNAGLDPHQDGMKRMNQTDLTVQEFEYGLSLLSGACQSRPESLQPWTLRGMSDPLGWMAHDRALRLSKRMPAHVPLVTAQQGWVWHADDVGADERSRVLQDWAMDLRDLGEITACLLRPIRPESVGPR